MAFLKNWKLVLFGGISFIAFLSIGTAYFLWERNIALKATLAITKAKLEVQIKARQRDDDAAQKLFDALTIEQSKLQAQITELSEINDEAGQDYLRTPVPNSVLRLLNP